MGRNVEYEVREYDCGYCGKVFEQATRQALVEGTTKKGRGSNQVQCSRCKNFLKNKEGKFLRHEKATSRF